MRHVLGYFAEGNVNASREMSTLLCSIAILTSSPAWERPGTCHGFYNPLANLRQGGSLFCKGRRDDGRARRTQELDR